MPIERVFLGWDGACLPRAVRWLMERYGSGQRWDLSRVVLVTPGKRSGRRLLELLVEAAGDRVLVPPPPGKIMTPVGLFDLLIQPPVPVGDDVQATLARMHALRDASPQTLAQVVPVPPGAHDLRAWLSLAADMQRLDEALAADGVTFDAAVERCARFDDFNDEARWGALAALQRGYEAVLERQGLADRSALRRQALRHARQDVDVDIVLIATADLPGYVRPLLTAMSSRATSVFSLVHAPASEADAFEDVGCLIPDRWVRRRVDLGPACVQIVDRPRDQAREVLGQIVELATGATGSLPASALDVRTPDDLLPNGSRRHWQASCHPREWHSGSSTPDQITVGLGDEAMAPLIERTLELGGVPARPSAGRALPRTRPGLFLDAWGQYLRSGRFDSLAALLRHPDVEAFLHATIGAQAGAAVDGWLTLLDRYLTDHVQGRVSEGWLGDPAKAAPLEAARKAIDSLAPPGAAKLLPLPQQSEPIAAAMRRLYGAAPLNRFDPDDAALIAALKMIGEALGEQARVNPDDDVTPRLDLGDAITLTLARLRDTEVPPTGQPEHPAVELLGWLELPLDDAPALIITGVNERLIPASVNHDAFLPDRLRRGLGLVDNQRRYARDLLAMTAILHSRPWVRLISGRRGADDEPLTPSRLLLACAPEELPARVCTFYGDEQAGEGDAPVTQESGVGFGPRSSHAGRNAFRLPLPAPPRQPITGLEVTAFRDYIACPYRFYLRHVLKLAALDDAAMELAPSAFGNLAHSVLFDLGREELAACDDADVIAKHLVGRLEACCRADFGTQPPPAVTLQREQLRQRLEAFAVWQATQVREGWRIVGLPEKRLSVRMDVDSEPFELRGRLDRIDRHAADGRLRIVDYKTGDEGKSPERTHRIAGEWVDLQLPLYRTLARGAGLTGPIELGYVVLPKKLGEVGFLAAEWSEEDLGGAEEEARRIVRAIRQNVFWPPTAPPKYDDALGGICMDECADRDRVIAEMTREMGLK